MNSVNAKRSIERGLKESTREIPALYGALSVGKQALYTVLGFFRYYLGARKSIVLVFSSMRTGSTLVKSLIGEAPDVSLIDEFNFLPYVTRNRYLFYGLVSSMASERVILLKKPYNNNPGHLELYGLSPMPGVKKVILYRDPFDTLCSLRNLQIRREKRVFSEEELVSYWCDAYESVLENTSSEDILVVKYEDLTRDPKAVTANIFSFIGSVQSEGVDNYGEYEWVGGRDDISDTIKGLKVVEARQNGPEVNPVLHELVENSNRVKQLLNRLETSVIATPQA